MIIPQSLTSSSQRIKTSTLFINSDNSLSRTENFTQKLEGNKNNRFIHESKESHPLNIQENNSYILNKESSKIL